MKSLILISRKINGVINVLLVIIIVLNIFNLLLTKLQNADYISFLDYTYLIVEENDEYLGLKSGDLLFTDLNQAGEKEELILYKQESIEVGEITEIGTEHIIVKTENKEVEMEKELVIGKVIKVIPILGSILNILLKPISLIIMIVILILTNISSSLLKKQKEKLEPKKPDFSKYKGI